MTHPGNVASIGVSRALGHAEDGVDVLAREGQAVRSIRFLLGREAWEKTRREDVTVQGLEPCLAFFGP